MGTRVERAGFAWESHSSVVTTPDALMSSCLRAASDSLILGVSPSNKRCSPSAEEYWLSTDNLKFNCSDTLSETRRVLRSIVREDMLMPA